MIETIGEMTIGEVLALALAFGPTKFVAGPLALLSEIVVSCDLIALDSYLVLAQGQFRSLIRWGHILSTLDCQDYTAQLHRLRASVQHWLYSTLVYASGIFVGIDRTQPLHDSDRQLPWETAVFPMPQRLADLTIAEVEDFVPAMTGSNLLSDWSGALSHQTNCYGCTSASSFRLHLSARKSTVDVPQSPGNSHEWRNSSSVHHHQNRETVGGNTNGYSSRPHQKSLPITSPT